MKSLNWTVGAIYMALFDWSVINAAVIMKDVRKGYKNTQSKEELLNEIIERTNAHTTIPSTVATTPNNDRYGYTRKFRMHTINRNFQCNISADIAYQQ